LKISHPKRKFLFQPSIFRFYVKLRVCTGVEIWEYSMPLGINVNHSKNPSKLQAFYSFFMWWFPDGDLPKFPKTKAVPGNLEFEDILQGGPPDPDIINGRK